MVYDYTLLNEKIKEVCGTQAIFAQAIKRSERAVSLKLNNKREWRQEEIRRSCKVLNLKHKDIHAYFFTQKVQN